MTPRQVMGKMKALYFSVFNDTFPLLFAWGALHFHFALGPANDVAGPDQHKVLEKQTHTLRGAGVGGHNL